MTHVGVELCIKDKLPAKEAEEYCRLCKQQLFTIGQVSRECHISKKALRFYEEVGVVIPDRICPVNGYRYYTRDTMNLIPVIKYYKQIGFKLQEIQGVQNNKTYFYHEQNFISKLEELSIEKQKIADRHTAINDWYNLLREASMVIKNDLTHINIKFLPPATYYCLEQPFNYDYQESVINIPWVNYLEKHQCEITGPVILSFSSFRDKMAGTTTQTTIIQQPVGTVNTSIPSKEITHTMYASLYHIGDPKTITDKYKMIEQWAKENNYELEEECLERSVVDYWSTTNINDFVTEVLVPIKNNH
ncbi:MerR family transcriptional regulator [Vagococcus sp. PNs007]|uniref:MerR family transcriptional regulator n=1 Tax=Vagococcus proximus TaxID=2991417 RepID=A0ABT5X2G4_9ENTE|nr:MerR family transcriptional regulator [Vagococcus proximus]MDF0480165.1 MerR family transcriptional regulator [Vagococcus proximus]